jgi:2-hydroxychromene-2-carboxylate isomerase
MTYLNENTSRQQREAKARRIAHAHGLELRKSRTRDVNHVQHGRFMLLDAQTNAVVAGTWPYPHSFTLDDVEDYFGL